VNTETIVHPKLQHYGLMTANIEGMVDWYRIVLGMTVNHRSPARPGTPGVLPLATAFLSNDEVNHRVVFFEIPGIVPDPDRSRHVRTQHIAFEYKDLDELLGSYARLKGLGILPVMAADIGLQLTIYYQDPDRNVVEINSNNFGNDWTATEYIRNADPTFVPFDPDKLLAARLAGASPWDVHLRAMAREFMPTTLPDFRSFF
jgi:catechol 2,3-dioxygenase-like lactoylglutathione lyase family enzyme